MRLILSTIIATLMLAVSALAAPAAKEFGKLPRIANAAISPTGDKVAAFVNHKGNYVLSVFFVDGSGKKNMSVGMLDGVRPGWINWANNEVVLAGISQNERVDGIPVRSSFIYTLDVPKKDGKLLITPNKRKQSGSRVASGKMYRLNNGAVVDFLRDDPDHILMSFSDDDIFKPEVQKVNVRSGKYSRHQRWIGGVASWYSDLDGNVRIARGRKTTGDGAYTLKIYDPERNDWDSSKKYPGLESDETIFGFTGNPHELLVGRRNGKDTTGLYVYDLKYRQLGRKLFHHDNYDVGGLVYNSAQTDVIGVSFQSETTEIEFLPGTKDPIDWVREQYQGFKVGFVDSDRQGQKMLVRISSSNAPGGLYLADATSNTVSAISKIYESLPGREMGSVIPVKYTARDGQKIPAYVTLPPSITDTTQIKSLPFIVLPHGGPYARDSDNFDYFAQFFATRGYGVLQMNFRGSAGYGKAFKEAGRENWVVMQEDVADGAKWLIEKGYANSDKMCVAGWSFGGYAALMGAVKSPDLFKCAISVAGVTDLNDLISDERRYVGGRLRAKTGVMAGFDGSKDRKANSPVKRASEIGIPVFLAHGTDDMVVHFDQFKRMKSALKKSSAKVTAIELKNDDHYMSKQPNRIEMFEAMDRFLENSLGESPHKN